MIGPIERFSRHLYYKVIASVVVVILLTMGISTVIKTWMTIGNLANQFEEETRRKARVLTEAIYSSVLYSMSSGHGEQPLQRLLEFTEMIESSSEVRKLVIFSPEGEVTHSADPKEIGQRIEDLHFEVYQEQQEGTAYQAPEEMAFCMVKPIMNDPVRCRGCHGAEEEVLGVLDLCLSMRGAQEKIALNRNFLITSSAISTLATVLLAALAVAVVLTFQLNRPVQTLVTAMEKVQRGNFEARVPGGRKDELGVLGRTFNDMIHWMKEYDTMKNDFISNVSHELRTPLTSIKYFAEVLLERAGSLEEAKRKRFLSVINEETDRLTRLIDDFLDLQKIEAGKVEHTVKKIHVPELIERCVATFGGAAKSQDIVLVTDIHPEITHVHGDQDRLFQVLGNLMSNAIKFTESGGRVFVTVGPGPVENNRSTILFGVRDEGHGIPEEEQEKIFDKFHQVDASATRAAGGTGLGLAITREIIKLHGGRIWVDSRPGEGATFWFTLPVCQEEEQKSSTSSEEEVDEQKNLNCG